MTTYLSRPARNNTLSSLHMMHSILRSNLTISSIFALRVKSGPFTSVLNDPPQHEAGLMVS